MDEEYYEVIIKNKQTQRDVEMEIADLRALKEILEGFDESKIDFELRRKNKTLKIKL